MRFIVFILFLSTLLSCVKSYNEPQSTFSLNIVEMKTVYGNELDLWNFDMGDSTVRVETKFNEDWEDWIYRLNGENGEIETVYSNDWDDWKLEGKEFNLRIKTVYSNDYNKWEIKNTATNWSVNVRTTYTENSYDESWNQWSVNGDNLSIQLKTVYSDIDNWQMQGVFPTQYPLEYRIAILFVPIITNILIAQELI